MILASVTVTADAATSSYDRQIRGLGAALASVVALLGIYLLHYLYKDWAQSREKAKESFATAGETSSSSSDDGDMDDDNEIPESLNPEKEFVSVALDSTDISIVTGQWNATDNDDLSRKLNNEIMTRTLSDRCRLTARKSFSVLAQEFVKDMDEELGGIDDVHSAKSGSMISGASSLSIYDDTSSCQSRTKLQVSGRITPLASNEDAWREFLNNRNEEEELPRSSSLNAAPQIPSQDYDLPNPTSIML